MQKDLLGASFRIQEVSGNVETSNNERQSSDDARQTKTDIKRGETLFFRYDGARSMITQLDRPIRSLLWILQHSMAGMAYRIGWSCFGGTRLLWYEGGGAKHRPSVVVFHAVSEQSFS